MCTLSMVYDHFDKQFPDPSDWHRWVQPPAIAPAIAPYQPQSPMVEEMRKLIAEFREAVAAARKVDVLTKQPDCEDPEKARLTERVAQLEAMVAELMKAKP